MAAVKGGGPPPPPPTPPPAEDEDIKEAVNSKDAVKEPVTTNNKETGKVGGGPTKKTTKKPVPTTTKKPVPTTTAAPSGAANLGASLVLASVSGLMLGRV